MKAHLEDLVLALFLAPALVLLFIFQLIPSVWTIWFSFTDIALIGEKAINFRFLGLENYVNAFSDRVFWISINVTTVYCLASLALRFVLGLLAALYVSSKTIKGKRVITAMFLLPYIIPGTVHPYVWLSMLETKYGTLNRVLTFFGLPPQSWVYARVTESIIMVNSWAGYAFAMIVLTSALMSIPKDYYELAEIYGASRWFRFRKITLPLIKYPLILCAVMIFKEDIDDFTYAYMFTGDEPHPKYKTELLSLYAYHKAFGYFELGYGCAIGFIIAIIVAVLILVQMKIAGMR